MPKQKTSETPTRIWTFGCSKPSPQAETTFEYQLYLAHEYRKALTEIELGRRAMVRKVLEGVVEVEQAKAEVDDLVTKLEDVRSKIKGQRVADRSRHGGHELAPGAKDLVSRLKSARDAWKAAKKACYEDAANKAALEEADAWAAERGKAARAAAVDKGLYWGTYLLVEKAFEQARKTKMDPQFPSWSGEGRIGVQLQGGLSVEGLKDDRRLQIELPPSDLYSKSRGQRRRGAKTVARLRVGSHQDKSPVWEEFPVTVHRPLPADAKIMWAWVKRSKSANRWRYELQLAMESTSFRAASPAGRGAVAVDVGWRSMSKDGSRLRVAYLADEGGRLEELALPESHMKRLEKADSLRGIRDDNFESMKTRLVTWLDGRDVPEKLKEMTVGLMQWRATRRLARLYWEWPRFAGDEDIRQELDAWRRQDLHLYQWEWHQRTSTLARRKEFYRQIAHQISTRYAKVILEKFDLTKMARRNVPEEVEQHGEQRHNRFVASISEFRGILRSACALRGVQVVEVPAEWTTIDCHSCGVRIIWDAAPKVDHTCEGCGATWDQDANAAINMLIRAGVRERPGGGERVVVVRIVEEPKDSKKNETRTRAKVRRRPPGMKVLEGFEEKRDEDQGEGEEETAGDEGARRSKFRSLKTQ